MIIKLAYYGVIHAKKNNKRIITNPRSGKPMIISNAKARDQEDAMMAAFMAQTPQQWRIMRRPGPFEISIQIWERDRRRRDLDNQATAILDALVLARVIPDDSSQIVTKLTVEYMGADRADPHAEITIDEV